MEKVADFTQFEEKKTHTSLCIIVHLCTIATVTVHICTVTVALPFNILMFLFIILMLYSYGIKAPLSHFFLSPFTGQHQCLSLSLPVSFLSSSSHLLSSSASYQLLLIVITTGNYVIGLGFLQPCEEGGSTWRYLYQVLGQFSLKKDMSFSHWDFRVFFVFWFQARFLGVSLN